MYKALLDVYYEQFHVLPTRVELKGPETRDYPAYEFMEELFTGTADNIPVTILKKWEYFFWVLKKYTYEINLGGHREVLYRFTLR